MNRRRRAWALAVTAVVLAACRQPPPDPNSIVVAMADPVINLDPRVGTDEASQKLHQLLFNTLVRHRRSAARRARARRVARSPGRADLSSRTCATA